MKLGDARLDVGNLHANLVEEPRDAVVLGRDGLELRLGDVQLAVEIGRLALELGELGALALEGSRQ